MTQSKKRCLKVLMNLGIALVILLLVIFLLPKVLVFFMPFLLGYLIAMIASPIVRFFTWFAKRAEISDALVTSTIHKSITSHFSKTMAGRIIQAVL